MSTSSSRSRPKLDAPTPKLSYEFQLRQVRLVAIFEHQGGALVKDRLTLSLSEGRGWQSGDELTSLDYEFGFQETAARTAETIELAEAHIVIAGLDETGRRTEVRGKGWVGYTDGGRIEGHFDTPPMVITGDGPEFGEADDELTGPKPKPSEEYKRALRGRALPESDGEQSALS